MPNKSKAKLTIPAAKSSLGKAAQRDLATKQTGKGKKRARTQDEEEQDDVDDAASMSGLSNASGFSGSDVGADEFNVDDEMDVDSNDGVGGKKEDEDDDELDTEDEIEISKLPKPKSKKNTKKNKLPTSADTFGATLASLLGDSDAAKPSIPISATTDGSEPPTKRRKTPKPSTASISNPILSLSAKRLPQTGAQESLERKAQRALKAAKEEREDRARVKDVIEGWGAKEDGAPGGQEWERGLRKVAQRGVIKLFNAILLSSNAHPAVTGSAAVNNERQSKKEKDNVLGRGGKEERLTKESFLDLIKAGGR